MFIIELTYIKPISDVEHYLPAHVEYLDKHYKSGHFMMSGRKEPRTGGMIIAQAESLDELTKIYHTDPFFINNIASFNVINFVPSKWAEKLNDCLS
ncbi:MULTISPECIES: YciI family protein [Leuconostoc]|uniref:YCII-related domain-containing protein n=2 Tax=Leuconostoc kimchii TaxID=136609 RepID=D5T3Y2_LEUKI|nr:MULTISPECIES: YciI family protein [Leuconostoc]ADG41384.1 hypothetical protein LKI_09225 [Leuconostoc kimchii IMSNU 11154]AEJ30636.1 hypothetical protein LGMK_02890 [Leuconostoc sp. C2]QBR47749.1 hypothetical protein EW139_06295 [Leuconostoc kimchii]